MTDFATAIARTLGEEGGYVDDPRDPGGETNWGITKITAMRNSFNRAMISMTREEAISIYKAEYWDGPRIGKLPGELAFQVFDFGVNHSPAGAVKMLQGMLGVAVDGVLGPKTSAAVAARPLASLILNFISMRGGFYCNSPLWNTYGKGWTRRVMQCAAWAADDIAALRQPPMTGGK